MRNIINKLYLKNTLNEEELLYLLKNIDNNHRTYLMEKAFETRKKYYGKKVFLRGLIEISNYCKNSCVYCGINCSNKKVNRYRLSEEDILNCCNIGYNIGYRTFVLQGGEDSYYTDDKIVSIIKNIKNQFKDVAVTLSIGEKSYESYKKFYDAGVDRYLLREETVNKNLYNSLHPKMSLENRLNCLKNLKDIGYQVGGGFMVGLPNESDEDYVKELMFLKELDPHMVGIGPFIPHKDTILKDKESGTLEKTITVLAIIRLLLPTVLLPATTALSTISNNGRAKGLLSGCNVIMPNLSPMEVRKKYLLYNNKAYVGKEAAQCNELIENEIKSLGLELDFSRGDNLLWKRKKTL